MRLNKSEARLLIIAIVVILLVSLVKWLLIPLWQNYQEIDYKLIRNKAVLKENKKVLTDFKQVKGKLIEAKGELERVNFAFFNQNKDRAKLELLKLIDGYIQASGLEFKDKSLQMEKVDFSEFNNEQYNEIKDKLSKRLTVLVCRLTLKGSLSGLVNFLDSLESSEKFLKIDYLAITANKSSTKLSINLTIKGINREGDEDVK